MHNIRHAFGLQQLRCKQLTSVHFAWGIAEAKCILSTTVCVSVCLSLAAFPHYCTDPGVSCGNGREFPLVVHCWANLQSMYGFRYYDNIHVCKLIALYTANLYSAEPWTRNVSEWSYSLYGWLYNNCRHYCSMEGRTYSSCGDEILLCLVHCSCDIFSGADKMAHWPLVGHKAEMEQGQDFWPVIRSDPVVERCDLFTVLNSDLPFVRPCLYLAS